MGSIWFFTSTQYLVRSFTSALQDVAAPPLTATWDSAVGNNNNVSVKIVGLPFLQLRAM